jgi:hypothetical protein
MGPIFILGNSRSGTTLLRLMLTCHENISIPPEGPFFFFLEPKYHDVSDINSKVIEDFISELFSVPKMDEWNLDKQRLFERLNNTPVESFIDLINGVHKEYMISSGKIKNRWGDKSGSYSIRFINSIKRSLPNAHLVNIIRDGRDVACSYRSLYGTKGKYAPNFPTNIIEIALQWRSNVSRINDFLDKWPRDQQTIVKYEDLVSNPTKSLQNLCDDIDEVFDVNMLNFHNLNSKFELEPKKYLSWKQKTLEAVSDSQVERWKSELSDEDVSLFEYIAGDTLIYYGYAVESKNNKINLKDRLEVGILSINQYIRQSGTFVKSMITNN